MQQNYLEQEEMMNTMSHKATGPNSTRPNFGQNCKIFFLSVENVKKYI